MTFHFLSGNKTRLGIISMILIIIVSYSLFFYQENIAEENIKNKMFLQQRDEQIESTNVMAQHISSDLKLIMSILQGLTDSMYLQQGELYGDRVEKLISEKFTDITAITKVDGLFIADNNDIISYSKVSKGQRSFINIDISFREYVQQVKSKLQPIFSDGYKGIDGKYKISLVAPIVNRENHEYIGLIGVDIPTKEFFAHYGNINNINSSFLVAYDRKGNYIITPRAQLLGENFFGDKVQSFFNFNNLQNDYYHKVLSNDLSVSYATYDFGNGERLNTGQSILLQQKPTYFVFVITPTELIYSSVQDALFSERIKIFSLILGFTFAVTILIIFLVKWNKNLGNEVKHRTLQLEESNKALLTANEDLQIHDTMQREFINVAAHELRTPTQSIIGYLEMAKKFPENFRKYLEPLERNSERLYTLTEDILDVSRIESNTLKLVKEKFDITGLVHDTMKDFMNQSQNLKNNNFKIISINCKDNKKILNEKKEEVLVYADKNRIQQVLFNLLSNSYKFTENGQIIINIIKSNNNEVKISIEDNGTGIDPEILPRLFEKFATKSDRGTGLGLYISKNIVEAHDGKIWGANNDKNGGGARFGFSLPIFKEKID